MQLGMIFNGGLKILSTRKKNEIDGLFANTGVFGMTKSFTKVRINVSSKNAFEPRDSTFE